ncbi:hypothetical protein [Novimethylophilus kurashikiensis]|uniref:hypothetical protein n=1 Tax=Novimethylophilus kurashikiensis TaxID=1825523 RepID=UPI0011B1F5CA|nr:hypothetical protein [Novimethylophilus kurashikiensis]
MASYTAATAAKQSPPVAGSGTTYRAVAPQSAPAYVAQAPSYAPPTVIHHTTVVHESSAGSSNFFWGYLLGSASHHDHDRTVVINNGTPGGYAQSAGVAPGYTVNSDSPGVTQAAAVRQPVAAPAQQLAQPQEESHFFRNLLLLLGTGALIFGGYRLWSARTARIQKLTPKHNYSL